MNFKDPGFPGQAVREDSQTKEIKLPVEKYREQILEKIDNNQVVIITAETGAGKSTQVPQYLLDAGYKVVVTQPRRLAARSVAMRVADEKNQELGGEVGFRTAYEKQDGPNTRLLFCTDGLQLVRELSGFGVNANEKMILVLDEVHEWNMNMETLVAWSKKQMLTNANFKVVLMSATLDAEKLASFFSKENSPSPYLEIPGTMFPVDEFEDGANSMVNNVLKLIKNGRNVLVFQPGKKEIYDLIEELKKSGAVAEILPLHGELEPADQNKVFKHYGRPKVVVATNIAQTSITIDDIDAVVDSGVERQTQVKSGVEGLYLNDISKADCKQRKGRAGRCRPGVYYLCSDTSLDERSEYPVPEIHRSRLDQMVLRLADNGLDATDLEFFHQPDRTDLLEAKRSLIALGEMTVDGIITNIGRKISKLPVDVHVGRMVIEAQKNDCLDDILTIASCMEMGGLRDRSGKWQSLTIEKQSDVLAELDIYKKALLMMNDKERQESGIFVKSFWKIIELRKHLSESLKKAGIRWESLFRENVDRTAVLKSVASGMVDHLYQHRYGNYYRNGEGRILGRESAVISQPDWLVALPMDIQFTDRKGYKRTLKILNMASAINPEWFLEIAPQLVEKKQRNLNWSNDKQEVSVEEYILFNGAEIKSERISATRDEKNNEVLFDALLSGYLTGSEAAMRIYQYNKNFLSFFEELWLRSGGKFDRPSRDNILSLYQQKLSQHMIFNTAEFDSVVPSRVSEKELCLQRENFLSEAEIARIEQENPLSILLNGKACQVSYEKSYYGDFSIKIDLGDINVSELEDECLDTLLPNDRKQEIVFRYQSGSYIYTIEASSIAVAKTIFEKKRLANLQEQFVSAKVRHLETSEVENLFKNLPSPAVYDEQTGAKMYPCVEYQSGWYSQDYRLNWTETEERALASTKQAKKKFYSEQVSEWYQKLNKLADLFEKELYSSILDGESAFELKKKFADLRSQINSFRYDGDLDQYEELKNIFVELEKRLSELVSKTEESLSGNEILLDFKVWHRRSGQTNLGDGWVIMPDGQLREPDEIDIPRHKSDGYYIWRTVGRNELALKWEKHNSSHAGDFLVLKKPLDGLSPEQLEMAKEIEEDLGAEELGGFGLNEKLEINKQKLIVEIKQTVKKVKRQSLDLSDLDMPFFALASQSGIDVTSRLSNFGLLIDGPFNDYCNDRDAQLVYSQRLSRGVLEFLVYEKYGQYNVAMRLNINPEELAEEWDEDDEIYYDEGDDRILNETKIIESKPATFESIKGIGSTAQSDNPFASQFKKLLKEEPSFLKKQVDRVDESVPVKKHVEVKPEVSTESLVVKEFKDFSEMTSDEVFEEYEANELVVNRLLSQNPDMEVIFKEYADCSADLTKISTDIKDTLEKRDLARDEKRRQMAIKQLDNLRTKEKDLKKLEKSLKEKVKLMQAAYNNYQLYKQRQAEIEERL